MQSIESTALEPTRAEMTGLPARQKLIRLVPVYGLVILTLMLIVLFSILLPKTFPTLLNLRSIVSDKAIIALLSLAAMIPMASGRIDLTVGYGIVLWHILAISLQTMLGIPWPFAVMIVLFLGAGTGFLNGLLVEVARIDSFIPRSAREPCSMRLPFGTPVGGRWSVSCLTGSMRSTAPCCSACRSPASMCWRSP